MKSSATYLVKREKAALKVITIPQSSRDTEEIYGDGYDDESMDD